MSKRSEYQDSMEEQLMVWGRRLEAKATNEGLPKAGVTEMRDSAEAARSTLARLKATTGDNWDVIKIELDGAWRGLQSALDGPPAAAQARPAPAPVSKPA